MQRTLCHEEFLKTFKIVPSVLGNWYAGKIVKGGSDKFVGTG